MPVDFEKPHRVPPPENIEKPPASYCADPMRNDPVGRNKHERKRLATIEKRIAYERDWIAHHPDDTTNDWRHQEITALTWALQRIADAERYERDAAIGGGV